MLGRGAYFAHATRLRLTSLPRRTQATVPDFQYRLLTPSDASKVVRHLRENFLVGGAIQRHVGLKNDDFERRWAVLPDTLRQNISFGAFDVTGELQGAFINVAGRGEIFDAELERTEAARKVARLVIALAGNVEETFPNLRTWQMTMGCVARSSARTGIAKEIEKRTHELAKSRGCDVIFYTCLEYAAYIGGLHVGYEVKRRINYADYIDAETGRKEFVGMKPPNDFCALMAKRVLKN